MTPAASDCKLGVFRTNSRDSVIAPLTAVKAVVAAIILPFAKLISLPAVRIAFLALILPPSKTTSCPTA